MTGSSTPLTVTTWGTFQLAGVKVRLDVETVPSVVRLELTGIVTSEVGFVVSETRKTSVPPASVVTRPVRWVTVIAGPGWTTASPKGDASFASKTIAEPSRLAR